MIKKLVLFGMIVFAIGGTSLIAQERSLGGPQKQKIETAKIAFLTRQMHLTTEEARMFWPLYDQYQINLDAQKRERRQQVEEVKEQLENMDETKANALIDSRLKQAEQALEARKVFVASIRKVLPATKVLAYFRAEELFQRELAQRAAMRQERADKPLRNDRPAKRY